jgi:ribulose-phosphate 3-epimerase
MSIVVPAILPKTRENLDAALARLVPVAAVENVQIDIVDGEFAKPASWPYAGDEKWELPMTERFRYDLDLMVHAPEASIARWVGLGASRITLHAESTTALSHLIADFKQRYGHEAGFTPGSLALGLALGIETDIATIESVISDIDYVQFMGIAHIGKQGQPFDTRVLRKIHALRVRHPTMTIQVDGGVSLKTASALLEAGVDRLVVGSALLKAEDVASELAAFEVLGEKYGVYER